MEILSTLWSSHLKPLWDDILLLVASVANCLLDLWNNLLAPVAKWIIATFGPAFAEVDVYKRQAPDMQAFSSHDIFQTLYQQIMLLELKPGSTLRENALCEQFGVSRTPVRSVLQELRIAGLIEVTPYKSTRVTQLDFDTISQQIYLRNAVESAVMTDFAAACTPEPVSYTHLVRW